MQVIASRNHKKGHIIYHRSRCIYEKRIHPDNKWSMDLEKAQKSKQKKYSNLDFLDDICTAVIGSYFLHCISSG